VNHKLVDLAVGLYFVATPIGNARDITLRALDILASADVLVAEDTRTLRRLMDIHGVPVAKRPLISYHDHSSVNVRLRLMEYISSGKSVAYASEAGTPLIADPGYHLSKETSEAGHLVTTAPGSSALLGALTLAGLPTDSFLFDGFLPVQKTARCARLQSLVDIQSTLVFYESPKRLAAMLCDARDILGPNRTAAYCRELTKKFEEVRRGSLSVLCDHVADRSIKGEVVVLINRAEKLSINEEQLSLDLKKALDDMSLRDASEAVARAYGLPRRQIYQQALKLGKKTKG
jgi:16S rRNA (cytidine1402-2'-O)-methyltransferase